jgi:AcrR family transcriptional regulator
MTTLSHMNGLGVFLAPADNGGESINDRIIEAARLEFEMVGIRRASMIDIARRARVSRATLYRRFSDKDSLVAAVGTEEVVAVLRRIDAATDAVEDPAEALVAMGVTALRELRRHRMLNRLLETEPEELYHFVVGNSETLVGLSRSFVAPRLRVVLAGSTLPTEDVEVGAEMLARLWMSVIITPGGVIPVDDDEAVAQFLRRFFVPLFTDEIREVLAPRPVEGIPG